MSLKASKIHLQTKHHLMLLLKQDLILVEESIGQEQNLLLTILFHLQLMR